MVSPQVPLSPIPSQLAILLQTYRQVILPKYVMRVVFGKQYGVFASFPFSTTYNAFPKVHIPSCSQGMLHLNLQAILICPQEMPF